MEDFFAKVCSISGWMVRHNLQRICRVCHLLAASISIMMTLRLLRSTTNTTCHTCTCLPVNLTSTSSSSLRRTCGHGNYCASSGYFFFAAPDQVVEFKSTAPLPYAALWPLFHLRQFPWRRFHLQPYP